MKKSIITVFALIFLFSLSVLPFYSEPFPLDVGNTNDYSSGGSDWGGGDWGNSDWGSSSWSSSGDSYESMDGSDIIYAVIIVLAVVVFLVIKSRVKGKTTTPSVISTQYPVVTDNTAVIEAEIQKNDPGFNSEKFIGWTKEVFMTLQTAWSERDWAKIRPFEKEELFRQHEQQLAEYKRLGRINVIERVDIRQAYMSQYSSDGNYEYLTVFMQARMGDYIIDEKTNEVIKGDRNAEYVLPYMISFMRKYGIKTDSNLSNHSTTNCPNCGAPTTITSSGQCEYCNSIITTGDFDWVMFKYEGLKPGSAVDNTPIK